MLVLTGGWLYWYALLVLGSAVLSVDACDVSLRTEVEVYSVGGCIAEYCCFY